MDLLLLVSILLVSFFAYKLFFSSSSFLPTDHLAILVTGCDSGFGLQISLRALDEGFHVFACCLHADSEGAVNLRAKGCTVIPLDVTCQSSVNDASSVVDAVLREKGLSLHGLINNAGVNLNVGYVEWMEPESVLKVLDVNTLGVVRVTRAFLPLIRRAKGRIVNICSLAAHMAVPLVIPYTMSKVATFMYTCGLRREMKSFGVHVSSISPFAYKTSITNMEYILKCLDKSWNEATPTAKEDYGEPFFQSLKRRGEECSELKYFREITEVIDCVMDALLSKNPKCDYVPDIISKIFITIVQMLPLSVADYLTCLVININEQNFKTV